MDFLTLTGNLLIFGIQNHVPKMENKRSLADEARREKKVSIVKPAKFKLSKVV